MVKRWYACYDSAKGAHMEEVHPSRPSEDGHFYRATDYEALEAKSVRLAAHLALVLTLDVLQPHQKLETVQRAVDYLSSLSPSPSHKEPQ